MLNSLFTENYILLFSYIFHSGIWDVLSNEEVVDFVRCRIAQEMKPDVVRTRRI